MTAKDIREFLHSFSASELKEQGILYGPRNLLMGFSIRPLLTLMKEHGVKRLESPAHGWFLDEGGEFSSPSSREITQGNIVDLQKPGSVFNLKNAAINPHFSSVDIEPLAEAELQEAEELKFGLERDMQVALRRNIEQLEPGLMVVDGGSERSVEAGRIDITAQDRDGTLVVIELKAGIAAQASVTQTLAYMASLVQEEQKPVRGILVASDFDRKVLLAAQVVPNLQLKQYAYSFTFKDR